MRQMELQYENTAKIIARFQSSHFVNGEHQACKLAQNR